MQRLQARSVMVGLAGIVLLATAVVAMATARFF